jgi:hypothetical protein
MLKNKLTEIYNKANSGIEGTNFLEKAFTGANLNFESHMNNAIIEMTPIHDKLEKVRVAYEIVDNQFGDLLETGQWLDAELSLAATAQDLFRSTNPFLILGQGAKLHLEVNLANDCAKKVLEVMEAMGAPEDIKVALDIFSLFKNLSFNLNFKSLEHLPANLKRILSYEGEQLHQTFLDLSRDLPGENRNLMNFLSQFGDGSSQLFFVTPKITSSTYLKLPSLSSFLNLRHPYQSDSYEKVPSDGYPALSGQPHLYNQQPPIANPPLKYIQPLIANQPPHSQGALNSTSQSYGQAQSYDQSKSYIHSNQHEHLRIQQEAQYPIQIQTVPSQGYHSLNQHIESNSLAKCCICNSSGNQPSLRQLTICNHIVHEGCFVNFTTSQISRGFLPEKCPNQVCVSNLEPQDVDHTLPESYKLRFQQLYTRQALINSGAEVFECPTCQNVSDKGRLEHLQCPYCKKYYCLKCNSEAHPGQMCRNLSRNPLCRSCQVDHSGMTCDQYTHFLNSHYQER